ncbi:MAG: efflux transporter outer membrane subunit [Phycisphaerales bacterium]|nr:efflux transporter outer membrane subunit [Phycisphaerales bacterium]
MSQIHPVTLSPCHLVTLSLLSLAAGVISTCTVGPDYNRPNVAVPATYQSTQPATAPARLGSDWWTLFNDPQLTALEEAATKYNPDLQAAMQRVVQAREAAKAVKSQFYPTITLNPSWTRTRAPIVSSSSGNGNASRGTTYNSYQVPFDLAYEIDVWGRIRRNYESAVASAQASANDYYLVMQTLQADVAQTYFTLRSLDTQANILRDNVELFKRQLHLTEVERAAGLAAMSDVLQVQTLLKTTLSQQVDIDRQRQDTQHALAILTGRAPCELVLPFNPLADLPPIIPAGLPSELLSRRPDVAQAEQNLIAANALVGVATANFLPKFTINATAGLQSASFDQLFQAQSRLLSLGPAASIPIFEGGQLTAQLAQAKASYLETYATYRSSVLSALRDVEDALNDLHYYAKRAEAQQLAVDSARELVRLTKIERRQGGLISELQLITADQTLLSNLLTANDIFTQRQISTVLLIKALGGGWEADPATTQPRSPTGKGTVGRLTTLPAHSPSADPTTQPSTIPIFPPSPEATSQKE